MRKIKDILLVFLNSLGQSVLIDLTPFSLKFDKTGGGAAVFLSTFLLTFTMPGKIWCLYLSLVTFSSSLW